MDKKAIDINQRIPLATLGTALQSYLDDNYSKEYVMEQLQLDFSGENRLKKSLRIVNKIIPNNPIIKYLIENKKQVKLALSSKVETDRNIILIALLNSAFPFSFYTLQMFGKLFLAEDIISRAAVKKHLFKTYGGNRSTENALDSVVPMYLEAKLFTRPTPGIYEWKKPLEAVTPVAKSIYQESFKVNNTLQEILDYQMMDPYFYFIV